MSYGPRMTGDDQTNLSPWDHARVTVCAWLGRSWDQDEGHFDAFADAVLTLRTPADDAAPAGGDTAMLLIGWAQLLAHVGAVSEEWFQSHAMSDAEKAASRHVVRLVEQVDLADRRQGRDLTEPLNVLRQLADELDDKTLIGLAWQLRLTASDVVEASGGVELLDELIGLHREYAVEGLPHMKLADPAAFILGAALNGELRHAFTWLVTLLARRPAAQVALLHLWVFIAAEVLEQPRLPVTFDESPDVHGSFGDLRRTVDETADENRDLIPAPGTGVPPLWSSCLDHINAAIDATQRRDADALTAATDRPARERPVMVWLLALGLAARIEEISARDAGQPPEQGDAP